MSLPDGWIQQYDSNYKRSFWVDTQSNPPRAIWVHPYEDEQFLAEHPEASRNRKASAVPDLDAPPPYDVATKGRTLESESGKPGPSKRPGAGTSSQKEHRRGVFGRLKDKAIGTKEEREEQKRIRAEQAARAEEHARQARQRQLEEREAQKRVRAEQAARAEEQAKQARQRQLEERRERERIRAEQAAQAEEQARRARMRELEEREAYMRAHGGYAPYHPSYGPGYNPYAQGQGPRMGWDNPATLLLGGLAGGLLLGDIFGGGGF